MKYAFRSSVGRLLKLVCRNACTFSRHSFASKVLARTLIDPGDRTKIAERDAAVRAADLETYRSLSPALMPDARPRSGETLNSIETPCALRTCGVGAGLLSCANTVNDCVTSNTAMNGRILRPCF